MNRRVSLETDLEATKPDQELLLGLGFIKSTTVFIFSYIVLSNMLKRGIGGMETVFIGVVVIGTFYAFLRRYDADEVEAYSLYLLNSLWFWLFNRGVKKLDLIKDIEDGHVILQNEGAQGRH